VSARREHRLAEPAPAFLLKERGGQPCRLVAVDDLPYLSGVPGPEHVAFGGAGPVVGQHDPGDLLEQRWVPDPPGRRGLHYKEF
jgi:hypothetical protein